MSHYLYIIARKQYALAFVCLMLQEGNEDSEIITL